MKYQFEVEEEITSCGNCPCGDFECGVCELTDIDIGEFVVYSKKPDWCPLKSVGKDKK